MDNNFNFQDNFNNMQGIYNNQNFMMDQNMMMQMMQNQMGNQINKNQSQNNNQNNNFKQNNNEKSSAETKDITNLQDAIKVIKILIKENNNLKNKLSTLEKKFEEYKYKMDLNCYYNQFDVRAYKLENIYYYLSSKDIIKSKEEFGLINKGVRHLFNKNIRSFECKYKYKDDEFDPYEFKKIFDKIVYSVLIVLTKDRNNNKRFGSFFHKIVDNNSMEAPAPINNMMMNNNNMNMMMNNNNMNMNMMMNNNNMSNQIGVNFTSPIPIQSTKNSLPQSINQQGQMQNQNNQLQLNTFPQYTTNNTYDENVNIYNSSFNLNNYFVFSLDILKMYYKEDNRNDIPNFSIIYNKKYQSLLGTELSNNNFGSNNLVSNSLGSNYLNNINNYKLSGKQEFNIKNLELYEIKI